MIKVYSYDAADGNWSDMIAKKRERYDAAGIKIAASPDGLYAEKKLSDYDGYCGYCRKFFYDVDGHERDCARSA